MATSPRALASVAALLALLMAPSGLRGGPTAVSLLPLHAQGRHVDRGAPEPGGKVVDCLTLLPAEGGIPNRVEVRKNDGSTGPPYSVYFIADWPDSPKTVAEFKGLSPSPPDMFFAGPNLILEWVAGDRPVMQAFQPVKGGAKLVFERGARAGFEYWGNMILQNNAAIGRDGNYHPTTTAVWQWNGNQYKLLTTVPYAGRLNALAGLEGEAGSK